MEVEVETMGTLEQQVVEAMFKRGIAAAVGVTTKHVAKLSATELVATTTTKKATTTEKATSTKKVTTTKDAASPNVRRLRFLSVLPGGPEAKTTRYEVSYEVLVPSSVDPDVIIAKANRIAESGSAESQLFRGELTATPGVLSVGEVVVTKPASKVVEQVPSAAPKDEKNDDSSKGLVIGLVIGAIGILCLLTSAGIYIRSRKPDSDARQQPGPNMLATPTGQAKGQWNSI